MVAEVAHQILLRLAFVVAMPARVQNQNVAFADVGFGLLDHLGRDDGPVGDFTGEVDDDAMVDQIIERQRSHVALAAVGRVHGTVEMGADMERGLDTLRDDHLRLQVLRVIHLVAGVAHPARRMHVHDVREIDDLHRACPSLHGLSRTRSMSDFSWPPSISIMVPLTMCISGEASMTTRFATSSTSAMRPIGMEEGASLSASS